MNRDDIIRLAREAGMPEWLQEDWFADPFDSFALRFAALVAAAEREACAKVCEAEGERVDASWVSCAFAIRERGAPALERLNKAAEDNGEEL
jgi:hypothetical protein